MLKKGIATLLILSIGMTSLTSCGQNDSAKVKDINKRVIYKTDSEKDDVDYSIRWNKMIDTYLIATSLKDNFKGSGVLRDWNRLEVFENAKKHFEPYKDHKFIKLLNEMVKNNEGNPIYPSAMHIMMNYSDTPELKEIKKINSKSRWGLFKEDKTIDAFISGLSDFYRDSEAGKFFVDNKEYFDGMIDDIERDIEETKIKELIKSTEEYIKVEDKKPVRYESQVVVFAENFAYRYFIHGKKSDTFVVVQTSGKRARNYVKSDLSEFAEVATEVFIDMHNKDRIDNIIKREYGNSKYNKKITKDKYFSKFPVDKQVRIHISKAIHARISEDVFGEEYVSEWISVDGSAYGVLDKLEDTYNLLDKYENNKNKYSNMNDFLPEMVESLMKEKS